MDKVWTRAAAGVALLALSACMGSDVERAGAGALAGGAGAAVAGAALGPWILVGAAGGALADDVSRNLR